MSSLMDGSFSWGYLSWTLGIPRHTACSQVQPYQGLHRTAMFEHANPQPSCFPNFNRCRCWHSPPPQPQSLQCFAHKTNQGRSEWSIRKTFKATLNLPGDKTLFWLKALKRATTHELYQRKEGSYKLLYIHRYSPALSHIQSSTERRCIVVEGQLYFAVSFRSIRKGKGRVLCLSE